MLYAYVFIDLWNAQNSFKKMFSKVLSENSVFRELTLFLRPMGSCPKKQPGFSHEFRKKDRLGLAQISLLVFFSVGFSIISIIATEIVGSKHCTRVRLSFKIVKRRTTTVASVNRVQSLSCEWLTIAGNVLNCIRSELVFGFADAAVSDTTAVVSVCGGQVVCSERRPLVEVWDRHG